MREIKDEFLRQLKSQPCSKKHPNSAYVKNLQKLAKEDRKFQKELQALIKEHNK